jgi:hypothetical protein
MALLEPNLNPTPRELRWFVLLWFPLFFALVGFLLWLGNRSPAVSLGLVAGALSVSAIGLRVPKFALAVYLGWMYAVYPIGWAVSHLVMVFTFYAVLTPTGLLLRLTGRDPLARKDRRGARSHWQPSKSGRDVRDYLRQF